MQLVMWLVTWIMGSIPDGSYNIKYEMDDGSTVDIGELVLDSNVYYSVTNNLTNCVSDNSRHRRGYYDYKMCLVLLRL